MNNTSIQAIIEEVNRVGYEMVYVRESTLNSNLRVVMAKSKENKEFATWTFNTSLGSLAHGHYFMFSLGQTEEEAKESALEDFKKRN